MDTKMKDGGPAFPSQPEKFLYSEDGKIVGVGHSGMSLRDWFAGQALAGMHARDSYDDGQATPEQRAKLAYTDADAMLRARKEVSND